MAAHLASTYGMDAARAGRAVTIARDCELNNEPVPGGYVSITAAQRANGSYEYDIIPHTS